MTLLLAFWATAVMLIAIPGPDWAFILAIGARTRAVAPAVIGLVVGYLVLTVFVSAGVGAVVAQSDALLTVLTSLGAGYLVFLGVSVLRHPPSWAAGDSMAQQSAGTIRWRTLALRGTAVSLLNPKGLLILVALLPQFADSAASWPLPVQLAVLGSVFAASCGIFYAVLGRSAHALLNTRPRIARLISRLSGVALVALGALLVAEGLSGLL
ncbi:LysE family translocator [Nesterenkonia ebinurensis]|uniref:LysE family translocator n=1 Tax=Nesterenkonia ebinurensis TaxID=2608252 RepID=UPI001CC3CC69|nr:LysE family translocator [Nesterenkonia ebinurensis]